ncbi:MAG: transcriptional regulator [Alphaproteobacteria bacterium]|nr:MAG: transcriptional regulator [Alphaproteobacteria bacterium]
MNVDYEKMRESAEDASSLLQALGQPSRLMILCRLAEGECSVGRLAESLDMRQSRVSQHLALLRREGLVAHRREGQTIHYRIADGRAARILELLYELFCQSGEESDGVSGRAPSNGRKRQSSGNSQDAS